MGAEPAKAAAHAQLGHLLGDQTAIHVLEMAGRTGLAVGALEGAVNYLATAVELAGDLVSPTLLLELAEAELATGRTERVREACLRALESPGRRRPGRRPGDAGQARVQRGGRGRLALDRSGPRRRGEAESCSGCSLKR